MDNDLRFAQWNDWLSTIYKDVQSLLINRYIFLEVQEVIKANIKIQTDDTFYGWMATVYGSSQAIGVRRQVDDHPDSISFNRLLSEIFRHPEVLSRERYLSLCSPEFPRDVANRTFDRHAGAGGVHIQASYLEIDMCGLKEKAEPIRKYVNKRVAHRDKAEYKELPTFYDLHACLDHLEQLLKKYLAILKAEGHTQIVPVWQFDWKEVFRLPWIEGKR